MEKEIIGKGLTVAVILLFVGIGIQPSFAHEISASIPKETYSKDDTRENGLGFIFCIVLHVDFIGRNSWIPLFVEFELTDYDTGELIVKKNRLLGVHLFKFLPRGNDYMINVSTLYVSDTKLVKNLGFFQQITIPILLPYYQ
jgi:hypothetical protein